MTSRKIVLGSARSLALAGALVLGSAAAALAAEIPSTVPLATSADQAGELRLALLKLGFTEVQPVERKGNLYLVKAMWEGNWLDLRVDANSGGISHANAAGPSIGATENMTDAQLRDHLTRLGYTGVGTIEREGNVVTVAAVHAGKPVTLKIDARTGAVRGPASAGAAIQKPRANLSSSDLQAQLQPLGYTEVRYVEEKGNIYALDALKEGLWVKLRIDPRTGAITVVP